MKITIPFKTMSLNKWQRLHWRERQKVKAVIERHVFAGALAYSAPEAMALVTITRFGPRELDYDNLVGGCKPLIDALKTNGLIVDDTSSWLKATYTQAKCKRGEERTEIEISYGAKFQFELTQPPRYMVAEIPGTGKLTT